MKVRKARYDQPAAEIVVCKSAQIRHSLFGVDLLSGIAGGKYGISFGKMYFPVFQFFKIIREFIRRKTSADNPVLHKQHTVRQLFQLPFPVAEYKIPPDQK